MGYRSTFITNDIGLNLPVWFLEKWAGKINVGAGGCFPLSSRYEAKTYGIWEGFELDIHRVIKESEDDWATVWVVFMGEDGALARSEITAEGIKGDHITKPV